MTDPQAVRKICEADERNEINWRECPAGGFRAKHKGGHLHITGSETSFIRLTFSNDDDEYYIVNEPSLSLLAKYSKKEKTPAEKEVHQMRLDLNAILKHAAQQCLERYESENYAEKIKQKLFQLIIYGEVVYK